MLRFGLLGGRWGPFPWELFVTLGSSCVTAAVLLVALVPAGSLGPWVEGAEVLALAGSGIALLLAGLARRSRAGRRGP